MKIAFASNRTTEKYLPNSNLSVVRILGLGCYLAWVFLLFYMTKAYPDNIDFRNTLYLNQTFSTMALAFGLAILGFIATRRPQFTISKPLIIAATAVMFIGSAFIIANRLPLFDNVDAIVILSGLLTGLSTSVILATWGTIIIPNTARTRLVECAFAFAAAISNCFILNFLPDTFTLLLILITPIATGVLALFCQKRTKPLVLTPADELQPSSIKRLALRACAGAFFFGLVAGFMDVLSGYRIFSVGEYYDWILLGIATLCAICMLLICLFVKRDALIMCYRAAIFLAILGCMLTPFMTDDYTYPNAIIAGSYIAIQVVVFTLSGTFVKRYGFTPLQSFCAGAGALYIGESLGLLLCIAATDYIPSNTVVIFAIAIALAACLLFFYLFLFTESDFINHHFTYSAVAAADDISEASASETASQNIEIIFAEEYGLSSREIDVFGLLIQGRSNARIQEELFISAGTVSTHINHIYRKCGVSNKQELLDIVQERQSTPKQQEARKLTTIDQQIPNN